MLGNLRFIFGTMERMKLECSVSRKMSDKYGEFTQDPAFQQKWWNRIPGL